MPILRKRNIAENDNWSPQDIDRYYHALRSFGKDWGKVIEHIGSKTKSQIYSRANKLTKDIKKNPKHHPAADLLSVLQGPVRDGELIKTWSEEET